jgi:hypothetical protein
MCMMAESFICHNRQGILEFGGSVEERIEEAAVKEVNRR